MKKKLLIAFLSLFLVIVALLIFKGIFFRKDINVLLISMDTARSDRLGCYGYEKNTTPNIDMFSQESVLFKSAVAHIPFTFPSHLSMMTGTLPIYHGSHNNGGKRISDSNLTLAEVLKEKGYQTGAIVSSYVLNAQFGLNQGFDTYAEFSGAPIGTTAFSNGRRAAETGRMTIEWLEQKKDDKFFLFTHFYDPHFPYDPPEPFDTKFKDPYDGEIASVDESIGQIIDKLKELDLYDNTLIIIVSDHGEMLGEHEEAGHGYYIYESAIKVPLIIKIPSYVRPLKVDDTVGLVDIFATVCSMVGITVPDFIQGIDLCDYLKGKPEKKDRYIYTESMTATKFEGNSLLGVVSGKYKYIQTSRPELYNVTKDHREENNLVTVDAKRARLMQGNLKLILDTYAIFKDNNNSSVDLETTKHLESLGYIGGDVDASLSFDQSKPDPKDIKYLHTMLRKASDYGVLEDWYNAKIWSDKVLAERPDLEVAQLMSAQIWAGGVKAEPDKAKAYEKVANVYYALKKYDRALENWNEVLKLGVDTFELRKKLAAVNIHLKNNEDAIKHFKMSLKMKPDQADVNKALGKMFNRFGQTDKAMKYWRESLEIDPAQAELHDELGKTYYQKGEIGKVIEHWTKAVTLRPDDAEMLNNLGWLHSSSREADIRNPQKALEYALRACELTEYVLANFIDTLALAYAANGQYSQAVEIAQKALEIAVSENQKSLSNEIKKRLELYKSQQPYYDIQE